MDERNISCLEDFIAWQMNLENIDLLDITEEQEDEWYEQYQTWLEEQK